MLWTIPCVCWLSYLQVYRLWHNVNWNWCLSQLLQNFILLKPFVPPFSLSMLRWWAAGDRWWPLSLRARARVYTRSFVFFSVTSVTGLRNQDEHSLQECPTFSGKWGIYLRKCRMFSRKCGRFSRGCGSFGRIWAKSCLEELIFWEEMASVIVMWQQCDSSVTANFARWGGVVEGREWCDSSVTVMWQQNGVFVTWRLWVLFWLLVLYCVVVRAVTDVKAKNKSTGIRARIESGGCALLAPLVLLDPLVLLENFPSNV